MLATLLVAGCVTSEGPGSDDATAPPDGAAVASPAGVGPVLLVLPPADGLAGAARAELRAHVDAATAAASADVTVLEPATRATLAPTVELAARRAAAAGAVPGGVAGTVCVLGERQVAALTAALARYPAARACRLPAGGADDAGDAGVVVDVPVDLGRLGRALGVAARTAAARAGVVVLDAGDPLLDRRWRDGVLDGALDAQAGTARTHLAGRAAEVVALLDAQAALVATGITPGSPRTLDELAEEDPTDTGPGAPAGTPTPERVARTLPPVAVVVLDGSADAAALVATLADRGVAVVAPDALLAEVAQGPDVVLAYAVRWELPLTVLLDRAAGGDAPAPDVDDVLRLTPGAAGVAG